MKDHVRRTVAYLVLRLTSANGIASVHDHTASKVFRFEADIAPTKTKVSVVDQADNLKISGVGGGGLYTLTNESSGKKISLKLKEGAIDGFDFESTKPYKGTVNGQSVSIADAEHGKDFMYSA